MPKPVKRVDVSKLNAEQKAALAQFIRDAKAVAPQIKEAQDAAQKLYTAFLQSPQWQAAEGDPERKTLQDLWRVKAEVRYVDHIETTEQVQE